MKIIDPLIDEGFKLLFGREGISEPLLIKLLNSIFAGDPVLGNIVNIRFTNTEHPNEQIKGRGLRYDITCTTSSGHHFIVEMQKGEQKHLIERSEYYVARAIASQGYRGKSEEKGDWDFSLMPVVGVFICNFKVSGLEEDPVTYGGICNLHTGKPIGASQCYVYIQLPCFKKEELECESQLDKWIYNIKNMGIAQRVAFKSDNEIFNYLDSVSSVAALDPTEREYYEAALKYSRDYHAVLATAKEKAEAEGRAQGLEEGRSQGLKEGRSQGLKEGRSQGLKEGRAEGRAEGLKEGRAEGLEEGRSEGMAAGEIKASLRIANQLLSQGMDPEIVSRITNLSLDVVNGLR